MRYSGRYETLNDPEDIRFDRDGMRAPHKKKASGVLLKICIVLLLLSTAALFYLRQYTVTGVSMEPTLMSGDRVFYVGFSRAAYGELVIFDAGEPYGLVVKRVAGLPGDRISIGADGSLFRNGEAVEENYMLPDAFGNSAMEEVTVADGMLFVLGDHRATSIDSRDVRVGQIPFSAVRGVVTRMLRSTVPASE